MAVKKNKAEVVAPVSDDLGFSNFTPYQEKKGEEYMNPKQEEHFRNMLNNWKQELIAKVEETVHHMQDEAANFPDPNDRASQESDFTMELRTRDRERKLIKKIEESLTEFMPYFTSIRPIVERCGTLIGNKWKLAFADWKPGPQPPNVSIARH